MKIKLSVLTGLLALGAFAAEARVLGPGSGGGGFVVDCAATILEPARVELLDLYEAREKIPGLVQVGTSGNLTEDYFFSVQRTYGRQGYPNLAYERKAEIEENLKLFFRSVKFVESENEMPKANDVGNLPLIPTSCSLKQAAFFADDTQIIYIHRGLWDKMNAKNQAALVQHEVWYREMRNLNDTTSELSRRAVAHVFAQFGIEPLLQGVPAGASSFYTDSKEAKTSTFFAYSVIGLGQKYLRLQFPFLHGRSLLTKTWIDVPFVEWNLKFGPSQTQPNVFACIWQTPNQSYTTEVPVQGTMTTGLRLRYSYKTGEPITLELLRDNVVLGRSYVTGNDCQSPK